uniref:Uncharacterized protein n=1 Tax=Manihot esculenta TaxID=3983 RepID=A0A2C9WN33_MANES
MSLVVHALFAIINWLCFSCCWYRYVISSFIFLLSYVYLVLIFCKLFNLCPPSFLVFLFTSMSSKMSGALLSSINLPKMFNL